MIERCLICMNPVKNGEPVHTSCSFRLFGQKYIPRMPYGLGDFNSLAARLIEANAAVTGVQKKLSLHMSREEDLHNTHGKLTFVGLWGDYILKPPVDIYRELPENELLTMKLAECLKISIVPNGLIRLKFGELAYITKRIDRFKDQKLPMEDFCQLLEKMTEDKYRGSVEQIGKVLLKHCSNRIFDALRLFEVVIFNFLIANADMHLKNYSLIGYPGAVSLSPAYDFLNTRLVISEKDDPEESALSINGKKPG